MGKYQDLFNVYKDKLFNYGIDYLRFVYRWEELNYDFRKIIDLIDVDNSNFYIDGDNWITFFRLRWPTGDVLIGSIVYSWVSVPIMQMVFFDEDKVELFKSLWKIDLYWSFFRFVEIWYFDFGNFYKKFFWVDLDISRVDYKFDFIGLGVEDLVSIIKLKIRKNSRVYEIKKDKLLTYAVWSKTAKRVFLRVYDKIEDILYKNKSVFYDDYLEHKNEWVVRLEFEFLNHFCYWYSYYRLSDLIDKVYSYIWFKNSWKKYVYFERKESVEYNLLYSVRNFVGRGKKILEMGQNPFVLLYNFLLQDYDKNKIIDLVYDLYAKL